MEQSGDNKAAQFLIQKAAINVQHGNAAATLPSTQDWLFYQVLVLTLFI